MVTRRSVLSGGTAALTGAILARHDQSLAQGLTGSIKVGYDGINPFVGKYVEAAAQAVMTANPDSTIDIVPSDAPNYLNQIAVQLFMGNAPDVFLLLGIGSGELAQGGLIRPLDEYLASWDGWAQYDDPARFGVTFQDQTWSVPYGLNIYYVFYRKDLFAAAGLQADNWQPQTRDDLITAAQAVQASNPNVIPMSLYAGANGENATAADFLTLILSNDGTLTDASGKWYIDSCPIQGTLGFYEDAFQTSKVVPQSVLTDVNPLQSMPRALGDGELAILHEQAKHYGEWLSADPNNAANIGVAQFPGDNGPFVLGDAGDAWYIYSRSKNPDLGWAFIEAFNSADTQAALGIEDPHLPARVDARSDATWAQQPLSASMLAAAPTLTLPPPEPQFRKLIEVVQNATGLVATGAATPDQAVQRYSTQLTQTMGKANVVSQPCP
jgi:multiple sugar transport system substrate-binding protein